MSNNIRGDEPKAAQLDREIKVGERWLIIIGIATVLINTSIAWIYWGQLGEMRKATEAARKGADAAKSAAETATNALVLQNRPWVKIKHRIITPLTFNIGGRPVASRSR